MAFSSKPPPRSSQKRPISKTLKDASRCPIGNVTSPTATRSWVTTTGSNTSGNRSRITMLNEDLARTLSEKLNDCLAEVVDADDRYNLQDVMHQILEILCHAPQLRQDPKVRKR